MEKQAERGMAVRPDVVGLAEIKEANFENDRLVFNADLNDDLIERVYGFMTVSYKGRQWHWGDFWGALEDAGYDWPNYVPMDESGTPMISLSRAQTWMSVRSKFPHSSRIYRNLTYSHYEAVRSIPDAGAHDILNSADTAKISVHDLGEIVKGMKGEPEKQKRPKILVCKHCRRPAFEDIPCEGCMHDVAEVRIEALQQALISIRDNNLDDIGQALRFDVDTAIKALEV